MNPVVGFGAHPQADEMTSVLAASTNVVIEANPDGHAGPPIHAGEMAAGAVAYFVSKTRVDRWAGTTPDSTLPAPEALS
jgi:hypothetical protein